MGPPVTAPDNTKIYNNTSGKGSITVRDVNNCPIATASFSFAIAESSIFNGGQDDGFDFIRSKKKLNSQAEKLLEESRRKYSGEVT